MRISTVMVYGDKAGMIGLGHWGEHHCFERGERNNDLTIVILKIIKKPSAGWPNMGQFQINLSYGSQGYHIRYCPYCREDLTLDE